MVVNYFYKIFYNGCMEQKLLRNSNRKEWRIKILYFEKRKNLKNLFNGSKNVQIEYMGFIYRSVFQFENILTMFFYGKPIRILRLYKVCYYVVK